MLDIDQAYSLHDFHDDQVSLTRYREEDGKTPRSRPCTMEKVLLVYFFGRSDNQIQIDRLSLYKSLVVQGAIYYLICYFPP